MQRSARWRVSPLHADCPGTCSFRAHSCEVRGSGKGCQPHAASAQAAAADAELTAARLEGAAAAERARALAEAANAAAADAAAARAATARALVEAAAQRTQADAALAEARACARRFCVSCPRRAADRGERRIVQADARRVRELAERDAAGAGELQQAVAAEDARLGAAWAEERAALLAAGGAAAAAVRAGAAEQQRRAAEAAAGAAAAAAAAAARAMAGAGECTGRAQAFDVRRAGRGVVSKPDACARAVCAGDAAAARLHALQERHQAEMARAEGETARAHEAAAKEARRVTRGPQALSRASVTHIGSLTPNHHAHRGDMSPMFWGERIQTFERQTRMWSCWRVRHTPHAIFQMMIRHAGTMQQGNEAHCSHARLAQAALALADAVKGVRRAAAAEHAASAARVCLHAHTHMHPHA